MDERETPRACPFCGGIPSVVSHMKEYPAEGDHPAGEYEAWVSITCETCGIEMGEEYRSDVMDRWNKRDGDPVKEEIEDEDKPIFIHTTPKPDVCQHDFQGWREFSDGRGGEQVCTKCGMGAMAHTLSLDF